MKIRHLNKTTEFINILKNGRRIKTGKLSVILKKNKKRTIPSVGVIIPKKSVSLATKRNFIRRKIYAFFEKKDLPGIKAYDIIVRVTPLEKTIKRNRLARIIDLGLKNLEGEIKKW